MAEVKCKNCNCNCHCSLEEHSDMYGVCSCQACACDKGVVQDDTEKCCGTHSKEKEDKGECCQQSEQENAEALTYENEAKRSNNE
jgi:hypothetical protein